MKKYKVLLSRSYIVKIKAKNKNEAIRFSEFYIGGEKDISNEKERKENHFQIEDIEMTVNDVFDAEQIHNVSD